MIGSDGLELRKPSREIAHSQAIHHQFSLTRIRSSDVVELFFTCRPDLRAGRDLTAQVQSLYEGISGCLEAEGASPLHVVKEVVYFRDATAGHTALSALRAKGPKGIRWDLYSPASILIEEPPQDERELCGAQLQVVVPVGDRGARWWNFGSSTERGNGVHPPEPAVGKALSIDGCEHFWIGNIFGKPGGDFYSEALSMFEAAERLLSTQHLKFPQVVRTWIYLREMERDYGELNRARRTFFQRKGVARRPASTGIGGSPPGNAHQVVMGLYVVTGVGPGAVRTMHTPTLNEAHEYGSDFSRGMSVIEGRRRTLYISGTASVDEAGLTLAVGDFDGQVERMLLNVETLLDGEEASWENVVSAVTYLKDIRTAGRFQESLRKRGLPDFPHSIVKAEVCRPELLCEMEVIAVVPAKF